jgi:hypothetical protein
VALPWHLSALGRLPPYGFTIEQPQLFLRFKVGQMLFEWGQIRDAERYFDGLRSRPSAAAPPPDRAQGQLEAPLWLSAAAALLHSDTGGTDKGWSKVQGVRWAKGNGQGRHRTADTRIFSSWQ